MSRLIVSDASIFINFAHFNKFDVLKCIFPEIIIPQEVYNEVYQHGRHIPGSEEIYLARKNGWIKIKKYKDKTIYDLLPSYINEGEREAIALFIELKGDVLLMDDTKGRQVANNFINFSFRLISSYEICDILYEKDLLDFPSLEMAIRLKQANFNSAF